MMAFMAPEPGYFSAQPAVHSYPWRPGAQRRAKNKVSGRGVPDAVPRAAWCWFIMPAGNGAVHR
jgi:hypothetical protein